jgi:hypothetical protein
MSTVNGMKVSNPLNKVIIAVETRANQLPHGWNGALYGRSSRDIPFAAKAFMNLL